MPGPSVSVIIPTYNRAKMVCEAVESVLAQTCPAREIIVVDDGSTDDTMARLEQYGDKVICLRQANQRVAAARNHGIRRATGELVGFLDSDDLWHHRKLELQASYLQEHPKVALVAARVGKLRQGLSQCRAGLCIDAAERCRRVSWHVSVVRACFATSSVLVRKSCLDTVGAFDVSLPPAEDRDMWIRIGSRFAMHAFDVELAFDRINHQNHLSADPSLTDGSTRRMIEKVFRELPQLRGRWLFKRRALSVVPHETAIQFAELGNHAAAVGHILRSLALWPLPYGPHEAKSPLNRSKTLLVAVLRMAGLKAQPQEEPLSESVAVE